MKDLNTIKYCKFVEGLLEVLLLKISSTLTRN